MRALFRLQDSRESRQKKNAQKRVGAGQRWKVEPEAKFSIPYPGVPASGIPYDWSIFTVYVNTFVLPLLFPITWLRVRRVKQTCERVKPFYLKKIQPALQPAHASSKLLV